MPDRNFEVRKIFTGSSERSRMLDVATRLAHMAGLARIVDFADTDHFRMHPAVTKELQDFHHRALKDPKNREYSESIDLTNESVKVTNRRVGTIYDVNSTITHLRLEDTIRRRLDKPKPLTIHNHPKPYTARNLLDDYRDKQPLIKLKLRTDKTIIDRQKIRDIMTETALGIYDHLASGDLGFFVGHMRTIQSEAMVTSEGVCYILINPTPLKSPTPQIKQALMEYHLKLEGYREDVKPKKIYMGFPGSRDSGKYRMYTPTPEDLAEFHVKADRALIEFCEQTRFVAFRANLKDSSPVFHRMN